VAPIAGRGQPRAGRHPPPARPREPCRRRARRPRPRRPPGPAVPPRRGDGADGFAEPRGGPSAGRGGGAGGAAAPPAWGGRPAPAGEGAASPPPPPPRDPRGEVLEALLAAPAALAWLSEGPRVRFRSLDGPSPFGAAWVDPAPGEPVRFESPAEALRRLH